MKKKKKEGKEDLPRDMATSIYGVMPFVGWFLRGVEPGFYKREVGYGDFSRIYL